MIHSKLEIIAFYDFNLRLVQSIKEGSISKVALGSKLYRTCVQTLLVFINVLEPLNYEDVKELALMFHRTFISIYNSSNDLEIENTWDKYKDAFKKNFKLRMAKIIETNYLEYGLQETKFDLGDGVEVPLNPKAFVEMYQVIDPVWFPKNLKDNLIAIKEIKRNLQDSIPSLSEASSLNSSSVKEYKSLKRARAFYLHQMYLDGIISEMDVSSKKRIMEISHQEFPDSSGKTTYEALITDKPPIFNSKNAVEEIKKVRISFKIDYEYGLKLYKRKHIDS